MSTSILCVDLGNGTTAAAGPSGEVNVESLLSKGYDHIGEGSTEDHRYEKIIVGDTVHYIGSGVQHIGKTKIDVTGYNRLFSGGSTKIMTMAAMVRYMALSNNKFPKGVDLKVCLPLRAFMDHGSGLPDMLDDMFGDGLKFDDGKTGLSHNIKINSITPLPQALAALYGMAINGKYKPSGKLWKSHLDGRVLILSVGAGTVEQLAMEDSQPVLEKSASFPYGSLDLYKRISADFREFARLDRMFRDGRLVERHGELYQDWLLTLEKRVFDLWDADYISDSDQALVYGGPTLSMGSDFVSKFATGTSAPESPMGADANFHLSAVGGFRFFKYQEKLVGNG